MVFNGEANDQDIVSDINFWCSTDDVTYPIADKTRNSNFALARISSRIMRLDRGWKHVSSNLSTIPVAVKDIVAGQDNYSLETKHLKILRVRIVGKDGVKKTLTPKNRSTSSDDVLNATGEPTEYSKIGFSIMPFPVPDYSVTGGLEIEYQPGAAVDLFLVSDTDKEPGFNPDFHRLVSLYASFDYCSLHARDRLNAINENIKILEDQMDAYFESRDVDDEFAFDVQRTSKGPSLL